MKKSFSLLIMCGIFAACLFSSCEKEVKVSGIIVEPKNLFLSKGDVAQLAYMVSPYGAENKSVKWTSQNIFVATVSETGLVTAIGEGKTQITATTNDGHFTDVVTVTVGSSSEGDSIALIKLHQIAENLPFWDFTKPMNQWYGVVLNSERRVVSITDDIIYINNPLDPSIGNLTCLKQLALVPYYYGTNITIPAEIGKLADLQVLYLFYGFTGTIPPELGNLAKLEILYLINNVLTGNIPKELGNLTNLKELSLCYNQLTGEIPRELGNLINLEELRLTSNQLTGTIPPELENLSQLKLLRLNYNQLTGSIPPELENLKNLYELNFTYNSLSGTIPQALLDRFGGWSFCPQNGTNFDNLDCDNW